MTGTGLVDCSPMAQGGLVVMAGMVALVITQSDKGGHQGKGLASMRWHRVVVVNGCREWLAWAWLVAGTD